MKMKRWRIRLLVMLVLITGMLSVDFAYGMDVNFYDLTTEEPQAGTFVGPSGRSDLQPNEIMPLETTDTVYAGEGNRPAAHFVDISAWNENIAIAQFQMMKSYGVMGVVVKLTEGTTYFNQYAASQINNARAAGLTVSAYHFSQYRNWEEAVHEAYYFAQKADELGLSKTTVMVADIEAAGVLRADLNTNTTWFREALKNCNYQNVMYYLSSSVLDANGGVFSTSAFGKANIWVASYPYHPTASQNWNSNYAAWQWSSKYYFPGISHAFDVNQDYTGRFTDPNRLHTLLTISQSSRIDVGINYPTGNPDVQFRFLAYNTATGGWEIIADWNGGNWASWQPLKGTYVLLAEVKNSQGVLVSKNIGFVAERDYLGVGLAGFTWLFRENDIAIGTAYDYTISDAQFRFQAYDLQSGTWDVFADWSGSNWASWKPTKGNYWVHVEGRTADGKTTSQTIAFYVPKSYTGLSLNGISVIDRGGQKDVGVAYTSYENDVKFCLQIYDLQTEEWEMISDWYGGNWATWTPSRPGIYWLHYEARDGKGNFAQYTIPYQV